MINLSIVQDEKLVPIPSWARTLTEIGSFMAVDGSQTNARPSVIGVCLPRIDYAARFVGVGILFGPRGGRADENPPEVSRLKKMLGTAVAYRKNEKTRLGILESINEGEKTAMIVERSKKADPSNDGIPDVRERRFTIEVKESDWPKIHVSGTSFDLEKGATKRQTGRAATQHSHNITIATVFSQAVADRISLSEDPLAAAFVEKQRFADECTSTILGTSAGSISAGDALNNDSQREGAGLRVFSASSPVAEDCPELLILEAGRRLGDQLAQLAGRRAIVLLARNRAGYKEAAANLLSHLAHCGEWSPTIEGISIPAYLRLVLVK